MIMDTHLSRKIIKSKFSDKQEIAEKKDTIYENYQRERVSKPMVFDPCSGTWIFGSSQRSREDFPEKGD